MSDLNPKMSPCQHIAQPAITDAEIKRRLDSLEQRHKCLECGQKVFARYWLAWSLKYRSQQEKARGAILDFDLIRMQRHFESETAVSFSTSGTLGLKLLGEVDRLKREARASLAEGIRLAADVAKDYDSLSSHPYRVSDCILGKLNVMKGRPRKNRRKGS